MSDFEFEMKETDVRPTGEILQDPSTSEWLRQALRSALERDPVEAANDADFLRTILFQRATASFEEDAGQLPGSDGQGEGSHAA